MASTVRIKLHTDTSIAGKPVAAGTIVEVSSDILFRLLPRGDVLPPEEPETTPPEAVESRDPEAQSRDPHPRKNR